MIEKNNIPINNIPTVGDMLKRIEDTAIEVKQYPSGSPRRKYLEEQQSKIIDQFDGIPEIQDQCKKLLGRLVYKHMINMNSKEIDSQRDNSVLYDIFSRMIELQKQIKKSSNKNEIEFLNAEYSHLMDFVDGISCYPKLSGENGINSNSE